MENEEDYKEYPVEDWIAQRLDYDFKWLENKYNSLFELYVRSDDRKREMFYFILN